MQQSEWEASCHHNGRCGLTGTAALFSSIPGSGVLVNGPLWCYFYAMKYIDDVDPTAMNRFFCTQPGPKSLIYGTESILNRSLSALKQNRSLERLFIENNCSVSLVGDDVKGIAERNHMPFPVYTIDSGGLSGSFETGFAKAACLLVDQMKPQETVPKSVNIWGTSLEILKGKEEALELRRLLTACGMNVIAMPGSGDTWDQIMKAPQASCNLVVRNELGLKAAQNMQKKFGIPYYFTGLPYGIHGTMTWLQHLSEILSFTIPDSLKEEAGADEKKLSHYKGNMESLWGPLWFDRILLAAPFSEAAGIAECVRGEWADTGDLTVHLMTPAYGPVPAADRIREVGKDDAAMEKDYENWNGGLLLGSTHEASRLHRLHKKFMQVNICLPSYEEMMISDVPLAGLRGAMHLFERIWNEKIRGQLRENNES